MKVWAYILLVFLILTSCAEDNAVIDERFDFNDNTWPHSQKIAFEFEMEDTVSMHDILILFRVNTDYRYSNMYVFMDTEMPNGQKDTDTLQFILADPTGNWLGNRIGNTIEYEIPVSKGVKFPASGAYQFHFTQGMQDDDLEHVMDFGIRVEEVEE